MGDLMDLADLEQGIMKRSEHERLMKQQEDAWKRQFVLEIERLKRDKELLDLKWSMKDSLRLEMARYKDLEKNWKKKTKGMRNETSLGKVSADS